jgi:hypothetical protein
MRISEIGEGLHYFRPSRHAASDPEAPSHRGQPRLHVSRGFEAYRGGPSSPPCLQASLSSS